MANVKTKWRNSHHLSVTHIYLLLTWITSENTQITCKSLSTVLISSQILQTVYNKKFMHNLLSVTVLKREQNNLLSSGTDNNQFKCPKWGLLNQNANNHMTYRLKWKIQILTTKCDLHTGTENKLPKKHTKWITFSGHHICTTVKDVSTVSTKLLKNNNEVQITPQATTYNSKNEVSVQLTHLECVTMSVSAPPCRYSMTTQSSSPTKKLSYMSTMLA